MQADAPAVNYFGMASNNLTPQLQHLAQIANARAGIVGPASAAHSVAIGPEGNISPYAQRALETILLNQIGK